jgi:hypothetical protein
VAGVGQHFNRLLKLLPTWIVRHRTVGSPDPIEGGRQFDHTGAAREEVAAQHVEGG